MAKYAFETVRWLRNMAEIQSHRPGSGAALLRGNLLACAAEIEELRLALKQEEQFCCERGQLIRALQEEVATLKSPDGRNG